MIEKDFLQPVDIIRAGGLMVSQAQESDRHLFQTIENSTRSLHAMLGSERKLSQEADEKWSPTKKAGFERLNDIVNFYDTNAKQAKVAPKEAEKEKVRYEHELLKEWVDVEQQNDLSKGWLSVAMTRTPHAWTGAKKADIYSSAQKKGIKQLFEDELPEGMEQFHKLSLSPGLPKNDRPHPKSADELAQENVYDAQARVAVKFAHSFYNEESIVKPLIENIRELNKKGKVEKGQDVLLFAPVGTEQNDEDMGYTRSSRNLLASAQAELLKNKLQEQLDEDEQLSSLGLNVDIAEGFVQTTEFNSTDAGPLEKLAAIHQFDIIDPNGGADSKGGLLFDRENNRNMSSQGIQNRQRIESAIGIVVDDDSELGGTLKGLSLFAKEHCKEFAGASVVMESPGVANMQASGEQIGAFKELVGEDDYKKYNRLFESKGLQGGVSNLTPLQLTVLFATVMNHEAQDNTKAENAFNTMKNDLSLDEDTLKMYEDTLSKKHYVDKVVKESIKAQKSLKEQEPDFDIYQDKSNKALTFDAFEDLFSRVGRQEQSYGKMKQLPFKKLIAQASSESLGGGRKLINAVQSYGR